MYLLLRPDIIPAFDVELKDSVDERKSTELCFPGQALSREPQVYRVGIISSSSASHCLRSRRVSISSNYQLVLHDHRSYALLHMKDAIQVNCFVL
jgi:hypothetical protein